MTLIRMDNILLVVDDLEAAVAFFAALGMELEGQATVDGPSVDRLVGLEGVSSDIAMMRTPDGHGRVELDKFHTPPAVRAEPEDAPVNALGIRRIMFAVDDIDAVLARLRTHGAELVGEVVSTRTAIGSATSAALRASWSHGPSPSGEDRVQREPHGQSRWLPARTPQALGQFIVRVMAAQAGAQADSAARFMPSASRFM